MRSTSAWVATSVVTQKYVDKPRGPHGPGGVAPPRRISRIRRRRRAWPGPLRGLRSMSTYLWVATLARHDHHMLDLAELLHVQDVELHVVPFQLELVAGSRLCAEDASLGRRGADRGLLVGVQRRELTLVVAAGQ